MNHSEQFDDKNAMNLKPLVAVALLSVAFGAQARHLPPANRAHTASSHQAAHPSKHPHLAQARHNMRQAIGRVRARFTHAPAEAEPSSNVPRPVLSAETTSPW